MVEPSSRYQQLRRQVTDQLTSMAADPPQGIRETLLIRDGYFCGHRFELAGWTAVWFFEEQQAKYFDPQGRLVQAVGLEEVRRQAA